MLSLLKHKYVIVPIQIIVGLMCLTSISNGFAQVVFSNQTIWQARFLGFIAAFGTIAICTAVFLKLYAKWKYSETALKILVTICLALFAIAYVLEYTYQS